MGATNPQIYYEDPLRHGEYKYVSFIDLINNFMDNMTGDDTLIGQIDRRKVIYQMKQGIRQFNAGNLREVKGCELELNDTLTAIYPFDYVSYVSVSYVDQTTGKLMTMNINPDLNTFPAFLQDNNADILFDNDGYILEGTSMNAELESQQNVIRYELDDNCFCNALGYGNYGRNSNFRIDATKNINGSFNTTNEGFHFSSDAKSKVIMLTYVSDGLESNDDKNIKINKLAESALYAYVKWQLLTNKGNVQEYVVKRAEKEYIALYRNATIKLMNIRHTDIMFLLNNRRNWLR